MNLRPCGTRAAQRRHRERGETCTVCKPIGAVQPLKPCGTTAANRRHLSHGEPPCQPCKTADNLDRKKRLHAHKPPTPTTLETIEEVEHLLMCGEGEHSILQALNTTPLNLQRRLQRAGRTDLNHRIFNGDQHMVWAA